MVRASSAAEAAAKRVALAQSAFVMKKYQLPTKTDAILKRFPALCKRLEGAERTPPMPGAPRVLCLGADLEKDGACLAVQCGLGEPVNLGTLTRETILSLIAALRARGWRCVVGLEACGFGWRFQRQLREAGAEALTFATEALTGRRKTNTRDAAALARLVGDRTIHGNTTTSRVVREPSPEEQQRRFLSRHRAQLIALRGKIEAQGRGLMYDFGLLDFPECWWGKKMWPRLVAQLTAAGEDWLREALEPQRAMAAALHAQILELDARLAAEAAQALTVPLPHGLGQLTALTAGLEVMDTAALQQSQKSRQLHRVRPQRAQHRPRRPAPRPHRPARQPAPAQPAHRSHLATHPLGATLARLRQMGRGDPRDPRQLGAQEESRHRLRAPALHRPIRLRSGQALWRLFTGRATLADLGFQGAPAASEPAAAAR